MNTPPTAGASVQAEAETTVFSEAESETVFAMPDTGAIYVDEPRVRGFVAAHRLGEHVEATVRLARECFPGAHRFTLRMSGEPGEYGECLFVEVGTRASVPDTLRQYHEWVRRWVREHPPWVTDLMGLTTNHA